MSVAEAMQWAEYRSVRGSLNIGRRIEQTLANVQLMMVRYMGDKHSKLKDFMPHEQPVQPATFMDMFNELSKAAGPAKSSEAVK